MWASVKSVGLREEGGVPALRLLMKAAFSGAVVAHCIVLSYLSRIGWSPLGTA